MPIQRPAGAVGRWPQINGYCWIFSNPANMAGWSLTGTLMITPPIIKRRSLMTASGGGRFTVCRKATAGAITCICMMLSHAICGSTCNTVVEGKVTAFAGYRCSPTSFPPRRTGFLKRLPTMRHAAITRAISKTNRVTGRWLALAAATARRRY